MSLQSMQAAATARMVETLICDHETEELALAYCETMREHAKRNGDGAARLRYARAIGMLQRRIDVKTGRR